VRRDSSRRFSIESLEDRRLFAVDWINQGTNNFASIYDAADALIATELVNRAIDDWEAVITDFNYDGDGNPLTDNTYDLTINAATFAGGLRASTNQPQVQSGLPVSTTISMDDNGGGLGWFFDETPLDDAEFTAIANPFQASFVDATTVGQQRVNDFYRTITHEIGHALGIRLDGNLESPAARLYDIQLVDGQPTAFAIPESTFPITDDNTDSLLGQLTYVGIDQVNPFRIVSDPDGSLGSGFYTGDELAREHELWQYALAGGAIITLTEDGGGHFYEGPVDPNYSGAATHPDELMNPGRTVPPPLSDPIPTTRQFISDLTVQFLADAYGYTVTLPSNLVVDPDDFDPGDPANWQHTSSMHSSFDSQTGTVLLQGLVDSNNETFSVVPSGDEMVVTISYLFGGNTVDHVSRFKTSDVSQIVIAGNGGTDTISVNAAFTTITKQVQYVVSSNEDSANAGTLGDGIVDLDTVVPGNQVALRAAIRDANGAAGARKIYIPRGDYEIEISGGRR
jgi:hypothetical protein